MHTVYLDASATLDPDLSERLAHLREAGHRLILVAGGDEPSPGLTEWDERTSELPADPPKGSWFLTADPATCRDRVAGLRTVLIGPREEGPRTTRCDSTARGLREAVLAILTADAMSGAGDDQLSS
jgi:hypothetical protein